MLFGLLALQNNFVTRETLLAALQVWQLDKTQGLPETLRVTAKLGDDVFSLLNGLVTAHIRQHEDSPAKSLAALSSIGSVRAELERLGDPEIAASLMRAGEARPLDERLAETLSVGENTSSGTRFRFLRPHARGGLGEVSVARDQELSREVALKEILPEYSGNPEARDRFVREAEITGQLEHPGIVPVYGLGTYADGRPFYAMRFIRGDSLKTAIADFHKDRTSHTKLTGERMVKFRQLLGRFIDVCQAIHYAHSRHVLHRDLKPENIMLGKYGETLVVDWGLAKADETSNGSPSIRNEPPITQSTEFGSNTIDGSALGTPEYMSPEQAEGRIAQLGPATDIYALGATLYCLLTGRAPFSRRETPDILHAVQRGHFEHPRKIWPSVPKVLEAICLKAMAAQPAERFPSALALAQDIERWSADEPCTAHPDSWLERVARVGRRHRTWVLAGCACLLIVTIAAVVSAGMINSARSYALRLAQRNDALAKRERALFNEADAARKDAISLAKDNEAHAQREANHRFEAELTLADHTWREALRLQNVGDLRRAILLATRTVEVCERLAKTKTDSSARTRIQRLRGAANKALALWMLKLAPIGTPLDIPGQQMMCMGTNGCLLSRTGESYAIWDTTSSRYIGQPFLLHQEPEDFFTHMYLANRNELAIVDNTHAVRIFSTQTGKEIASVSPKLIIESKTPLVEEFVLDVSPASNRFVTGGGMQAIVLWDAIKGVPIGEPYLGDRAKSIGKKIEDIEAHSPATAAFSHDGKRLAIACGPLVTMINAEDGTPTGQTLSHSATVTALAFHPSADVLTVGCDNGSICVWDIATGRESLRFASGEAVIRLRYSPLGKHLLSQSGNTVLQLWDARLGRRIGGSLPSTFAKTFAKSEFTADDRYLVAVGDSIRIVDTDSGLLVTEPVEFYAHHVVATSNAFLATAADGTTLAFTIVPPHLESTSSLKMIDNHGSRLGNKSEDISPNGRYAAIASTDGSPKTFIKVFDLEKDLQLGSVEDASAFWFSRDSRHVWISTNKARRFELKKGLPSADEGIDSSRLAFADYVKGGYSIGWTADGQLHCMDTESGARIGRPIMYPYSPISNACLSADKSLCAAVVSKDGNRTVVADLVSGTVIGEIPGGDFASCVAFSQDSSVLYLRRDKYLEVFDTANLQLISTLAPPFHTRQAVVRNDDCELITVDGYYQATRWRLPQLNIPTHKLVQAFSLLLGVTLTESGSLRKLNPDDSAVQEAIDLPSPFRERIASQLVQDRRYDLAIAILESTVIQEFSALRDSESPTSATLSKLDRLDYLYARADVRRKIPFLRRLHESLSKSSSQNAVILRRLAEAALIEGQTKEALEYADLLHARQPTSETLLLRAACHQSRGSSLAALEDLKMATEQSPDNTLAQYELSVLYAASQRLQDHRTVCGKLSLQSKATADPYAVTRVGYANVILEDPERDWKSILVLLEKSFASSDFDYRLVGACHFRMKDYDKALAAFTEFRKRHDLRGWDMLFLSMIHYHLGQHDEARQHYRTALEFAAAINANPNFNSVHAWPEKSETELLRTEAAALIETQER